MRAQSGVKLTAPQAAATPKKVATPAKKPTPLKVAAPTKATAPLKAVAPVKAVAPKAAVAKAAPAKAAVSAKAAVAVKDAVTVNAAARPSPTAPLKGKAVKTVPVVVLPPTPKGPKRKSIKEIDDVSTDAVARRTGKNWDAWFEVLDNAGAATLDLRGIVAILAQKHGIGPWWQQKIAVSYDSMRATSEKPPVVDGFQISSSCTLDAPLTRVFRLWNDSGERARWLADDRFVVRATTADKVIRARWGKGTSHVAVSFADKAGRTEVSVEHHQIESRSAADQMKAYWAKKLGLLDQALAPRR